MTSPRRPCSRAPAPSRSPAPKHPRLSVLMSVYNGERYLREAVESILDQTFTDFEFIVVDDGSTDSTWSILSDYAARDARIVLIRNPVNIGLTRSLNKGLALAQGEYIARQDADDVSLPRRLERQLSYLEQHREVGGLGTWAEIIDEENTAVRTIRTPTEHAEICAQLLLWNPLIHTSLCARRSSIDVIGGYNAEIPYAQDYDLWWRLSRVQRLACLPQVLVKKRERTPGSITDRHQAEQAACARQISLRIVQETAGLSHPSLASYERLWWTMHGRPEKWQPGDARSLAPLWRYLSAQPPYRLVWGPWTVRLACSVAFLQPGESLYLAWVAHRYFKQHWVWLELAKTWGRRCLPMSVRALYRVLRRRLSLPPVSGHAC